MKNFIKSKYFTYILAAAFSIAFVAFFIFNPSHAFFQVHKDFTGVNTAKVDLLFDKFDASGDYGEISVDLGDTWGTPKNPYVIDDTNHISNLSVLQKSGYFNSKDHQCFFVVCTPSGYPVAIDCDGMEIAPIGSPALPFTGSIQGAPLAVSDYTGEGTPYADTKFTNVYEVGNNKFTVTQSTIANLVVAATDSTPDIGFFGRLSYTGEVKDVVTEEKDEDGNVIASITTKQLTGFAANLDNLLFADVTITTKQNPGSDLAAWWAQFTGTREDGTPYSDQEHEGCDETHHLGIIAGHAEWAKITKISVYYSEDVPAFNVGEDTTNYYSIVGLIGTLSYVNPTDGTTAGTATAVGSVSDKQLSEELLSGGGGEGSGMLTGYMLAENIFDRKDDSNQKTIIDYYAEAYDIRTLTENEKSLFKQVTMTEKLQASSTPTYKNYYYFADTIFTFAMTSSVLSDAEGNPTGSISSGIADFLIKIWKTDEKNLPITKHIELTNSSSDWTYGTDPDTVKYIYKLSAVDTLVEDVTNSGDDVNYVLAYNTGSLDQPYLYVLDMFNPSSGYALPVEAYTSGTTYTVTENGNQITSMYVLDVDSTMPSYAFLYNARYENHTDTHDARQYISITDSRKGNSFGLTASPLNKDSVGYFGDLELRHFPFNNSSGYDDENSKMVDLSSWEGDSSTIWYGWNFAKDTATANTTNDFTLSGSFYQRDSGGWWGERVAYTAYSAKLVFNKESKQFELLQNKGTGDSRTRAENNRDREGNEIVIDENIQKENLLVFKIEKVPVEAIKSETFINSNESIVYSFDPSTDVLFCNPAKKPNENTKIDEASLNATKNYTVTPLLSKKWNNGKGQYLSQLNHTIKLAEAETNNFQMNFSNTQLPDWFKNYMKTNTGGVVLAPLGTTGVNFTLPRGTIAFYINKASPEEPSTINIIVSVGPGDGDATIGLFGPQDITNTRSNFKLDDPYQAFSLPVSRVATGSSDTKPLTHISGYYNLETDSATGEETYVLHKGENDQGYYTYLSADIVFVGCTFEVTEPGVYLLAPTVGKMAVSYFSVDGAAGAGGDGTGGSPLGDIDFVYDDGNNTILTVDKKFSGSHVVSDETPETAYYPSYYYIRMIPDADYTPTGANDPRDGVFPSELLYIRRYLVDDPPQTKLGLSDRRRIIKLTAADDDTSLLGLSAIYEDVNYDDITNPTS